MPKKQDLAAIAREAADAFIEAGQRGCDREQQMIEAIEIFRRAGIHPDKAKLLLWGIAAHAWQLEKITR